MSERKEVYKFVALRRVLIVILIGWPIFLIAYDIFYPAQITLFAHRERFNHNTSNGTPNENH